MKLTPILRRFMKLAAVLGLALPAAHAQDVGDIELIAYWDFENTAQDSWGGFEGYLGGDATYTDGEKFGFALDTSALGGSFFRIQATDEAEEGNPVSPEFFDAYHATVSARDQVTYTFWQKNNDEELLNQVAFWTVSEESDGSQRGAQAHTPWSNDAIFFDTAGCCVPTQRLTDASGVADWTVWNHFAFVKDGEHKEIWVNGELLIEGDGYDPLPEDMIAHYIGNGVEENRDQPGLIDEFGIIAGAASEGQIKELAGGATVIDIFDPSDPNFAIGKAVSFGQVAAVSGAQELTFSFKNTGDTMALNISSAQFVSGDTDNFTLVSAPTTLGAEEKGEVVVSFDSNSEFRQFEAVLEFKTDDPDADDQTVLVPVRAKVLNPVGPKAHLPLDETTGDVASDTTGFDRHGSYSGATLGQPGLTADTGTAVSFGDGSNVSIPSSAFGPLPSFTVSLWANAASNGDAGAADFRTLVAKGEANPAFGLLEAGGELLWFREEGVAFSTTSTPITAGTNYHLVMRLDGESGMGSIFVDGVEVITEAVDAVEDDAGSFYIGAFSGALGFSGTIDDVQIYDMAITNDQVAFLKNNPGQELRPDGPIDSDGDGLSDEDELAVHNTDPFNSDSDDDSLSDGEEVSLGTNPNSGDSDGDGFSDAFEIAQGSDPNDAIIVPGDPFGQPTQSWFVLEVLPTLDGVGNGDDGNDATFRVFIDLEATDATEDEREMIWESGGGTIGFSLVYETGNKLVLRAAGDGGNGVATVEYEVTADQLAAGELSIVWTFDVDNEDAATGQTISLYVDEVLVGQDSQPLSPDWTGSNAAVFGVASSSFAAGGENTVLDNGVDFRSGTINLDTGLQFFADKLFVPSTENTILILGTGVESLLGGDLTDPENDGLDEAGAAMDPSWNWVNITGNIEDDFGDPEQSFNIFDNQVGGGGAKWCCDDPSPDNPYWVSVEFADAVSLTHFTITNGNDTVDRDPTNWAIQGSNDGETFENIFAELEVSIWSETRNEVALVTLGVPSAPYKHIRYIVFDTPGALHQLNEIEYFGNVMGSGDGGGAGPVVDVPNIGTVIAGPDSVGLSFTGLAGKTYDIEYSADLVTWTVVMSGLTGDVSFEDSDAARLGLASGFYRGVQN